VTRSLGTGRIDAGRGRVIGWDRWPSEPLPRRPIPAIVPHLTVEVLSETNTEREMENKLRRYFQAGVQLVW
jgi:Uma2 family endonuclease